MDHPLVRTLLRTLMLCALNLFPFHLAITAYALILRVIALTEHGSGVGTLWTPFKLLVALIAMSRLRKTRAYQILTKAMIDMDESLKYQRMPRPKLMTFTIMMSIVTLAISIVGMAFISSALVNVILKWPLREMGRFLLTLLRLSHIAQRLWTQFAPLAGMA